MANTKTLLDLLTLRNALTRALAGDCGAHASELVEEIECITVEIALCVAAEF